MLGKMKVIIEETKVTGLPTKNTSRGAQEASTAPAPRTESSTCRWPPASAHSLVHKCSRCFSEEAGWGWAS